MPSVREERADLWHAKRSANIRSAERPMPAPPPVIRIIYHSKESMFGLLIKA